MLSRSREEVVSKDGGERRLLHGQKLNTRITYREVPGNSKTSAKTVTTPTALKSPVPLPPATTPKIFDGGRGRGRGTDIQGNTILTPTAKTPMVIRGCGPSPGGKQGLGNLTLLICDRTVQQDPATISQTLLHPVDSVSP
ncbi:hypothetical protein DAPPUDRAFT_301617 [Daphnia pulex]|uniref:Uncharacterized protein n=1 Tax=Daphnia pulex TaxID=6669 RepID=E9G9L3_DAPPU|nr:hypothetical protein DAPPUDRAFT_301617 [Daphnia pulex]|eukprot:EFX83585.1 hypothetical protein DAPPUDRAFT_301617 [Daphnia pulex]